MSFFEFTKNFLGSGFGNATVQSQPVVCGVPLSSFSSVAKGRYSVVLRATPRGEVQPTVTIGAWLQHKIVFETKSNWEPVVDMSNTGAVGDLFQLAGTSLSSTMTSRRKWKGTDPITMTLSLRFEVFEDAKKEVIEPCLRLQQLALPSRGLVNVSGESFLLQPPGPNPFYIEAASGIKVLGHQPFGKCELIEIDIGGGFLNFGGSSGGSGVIINSVKITYDNRMSKDGPIGAQAELSIQTYEMLTRERLADIYCMNTKSSFTNNQ